MNINVEMIFGTVQMVQTRKVEGSKIYLGGYAIHRDRHGNETRRTPNQWNCAVECWSEKEAKRLAPTADTTPSESPQSPNPAAH